MTPIRAPGGLAGEGTLEPRPTSRLLDRMASYLQARAEFALARPLYERALAIRERALGPDHPSTNAVRRNLGELIGETERSSSGSLTAE